jgi:signal transduction histidine kinase
VQLSSNAQLVITVSDTGPGLTRENLAHLFEPFCRVSRGSIPLHAGLGLSLARRLAIAIGGELSCDSEAGQSARFVLCVPVALTAAAR